MRQRTIITIFTILYISFSSFSQDKAVIDSVNIKISETKSDTTLIRLYNKLGDAYIYYIPDSALKYNNLSLDKAEWILTQTKDRAKILYVKEKMSESLNDLGYIYYGTGNIQKAIFYFKKALKVRQEINDKKGIASSLNNIGIIYYNQGNISGALFYHTKALKIREELGKKIDIANSLNEIGVIYNTQNDFENALSYYLKSLKIRETIGDSTGIAYSYNNIGALYEKQNQNDEAISYYKKSLKIRDKLRDKTDYAYTLNNIGKIYAKNGDYKKALTNFKKSLRIAEEIENKNIITLSLYYIGETGFKEGNIKSAEKYAKLAYKYSKELGYPERIKNSAKLLKEIYKSKANYKLAFKYYEEEILMRDSITNKETQAKTYKQQAKYEYEKQAALDSISNAKELEVRNVRIAKIEKEKILQEKQRNLLLLVLVLVVIFVVFVIRSYFQKQKANKILSIQKKEISEANNTLSLQNEEISAQRDEITRQKELVEKIHFKISDSIDYAMRLQESILPKENILAKYVSDSFVLFKPKDKVSGDFYWWANVNDYTIITAADSTGHGVPGAFMSMLGSSLLREIVQKESITNTGQILDELRSEIIKALKQTDEIGGQKDGMDMAIISINHKTNVVQFSGANNPLYIISSKHQGFKTLDALDNNKRTLQGFETLDVFGYNLYEVKPDKMPISIFSKMRNFKTHEIQLEKGDQVYMFSDGFPDQFGGPKNKKFRYKPFKQLLINNCQLPMNAQKEALNKAFEEWKGDYEQIDDVVIVGIKI